ncbi:glycosidase related protein [Thermaerobacter marianensis DSM 12885]|uniref:Glycosidase related protein n=1 Tax=Thermaerobacter marianensis (strain ATCC 700841 / DSM 12885 / JCM 10246 / 7p75a) TaxID=644966 RepID=E6SGR0_THEM7|nr:glycoside hydrolase family 130 protein [Thermaerobacter marianensis]ADU51644.1 glycosidase related protein [Thermaerobacter marianensis DSM 12885]
MLRLPDPQHATSYLLGPFVKHPGNPILAPQGSTWEAKDVFNPAAVVKDGRVYLLYRAEDHTGPGQWNGTSRIGLAVSDDGIHFQRYPDPVLEPTEPYEWPGGCEDPRLTCIDGRYFLTYTAYDGASARLCLATSTDLVRWEKHGVLFPDWDGGTGRVWSKSGAICPEKINGRYVMYFGDTSIWVATSEDGIRWEPEPEPVLQVRPEADAFDTLLVEPGPAPLVTDRGILLVYNAAHRLADAERVRRRARTGATGTVSGAAVAAAVTPAVAAGHGPGASAWNHGTAGAAATGGQAGTAPGTARRADAAGAAGSSAGSRGPEGEAAGTVYGGPSSSGYVRYAAGQALFDLRDPRKLIWRSTHPFFEPETDDEIRGQVDHVVFVEGLVEHRGTWFLYYGMADSRIGVATYRPA